MMSEKLKIFVGLGNPGNQYEHNRHNVGFMFLDSFKDITSKFSPDKAFYAEVTSLSNTNIKLVKPTTFMNTSGRSVSAVFSYYKISLDDLYVIHDDLDLRLGEYKIQKGVGPKIHNGVNSIEESLNQKDFFRIRIGVDNRDPENRIQGEQYVLSDFNDEELIKISQVFENIKRELNQKGAL